MWHAISLLNFFDLDGIIIKFKGVFLTKIQLSLGFGNKGSDISKIW